MPEPINQFAYVMAKGEGNKGASYKYTWRPDWRLPPGVSQTKVFLQVAFWLGLAAVPIWGIPYLRGNKTGEQTKREDVYAAMKKKNREERLRWAKSDDMPYK